MNPIEKTPEKITEQPKTKKVMNIYQKLLNVMSKVQRVEKRGRNDFHKYDYVLEADLIDEVRGYLIEEHLIVLNTVESSIQQGDITYVTVEYLIINADEPEQRLTLKGVGQGKDAGDKGVYKALTGAMKYFLMKNFLIASGDDPEKDNDEKELQQYSQYPRPAQFKTPVQNSPTAIPNPVMDTALQYICPTHKKPMTNGQYGWYCKTKVENGWCKYKPQIKEEIMDVSQPDYYPENDPFADHYEDVKR